MATSNINQQKQCVKFWTFQQFYLSVSFSVSSCKKLITVSARGGECTLQVTARKTLYVRIRDATMRMNLKVTVCTLTRRSRHRSLQCSVSVGLVADQFGELVPASQQLLQTLHQIVVGIEINPVGDLSHLTSAERRKIKQLQHLNRNIHIKKI